MSKNTDNVYHQIGVAMTCRSFQEYIDMFVLGDLLKKKKVILDVAGGASSFIAEANSLGHDASLLIRFMSFLMTESSPKP